MHSRNEKPNGKSEAIIQADTGATRLAGGDGDPFQSPAAPGRAAAPVDPVAYRIDMDEEFADQRLMNMLATAGEKYRMAELGRVAAAVRRDQQVYRELEAANYLPSGMASWGVMSLADQARARDLAERLGARDPRAPSVSISRYLDYRGMSAGDLATVFADSGLREQAIGELGGPNSFWFAAVFSRIDPERRANGEYLPMTRLLDRDLDALRQAARLAARSADLSLAEAQVDGLADMALEHMSWDIAQACEEAGVSSYDKLPAKTRKQLIEEALAGEVAGLAVPRPEVFDPAARLEAGGSYDHAGSGGEPVAGNNEDRGMDDNFGKKEFIDPYDIDLDNDEAYKKILENSLNGVWPAKSRDHSSGELKHRPAEVMHSGVNKEKRFDNLKRKREYIYKTHNPDSLLENPGSEECKINIQQPEVVNMINAFFRSEFNKFPTDVQAEPHPDGYSIIYTWTDTNGQTQRLDQIGRYSREFEEGWGQSSTAIEKADGFLAGDIFIGKRNKGVSASWIRTKTILHELWHQMMQIRGKGEKRHFLGYGANYLARRVGYSIAGVFGKKYDGGIPYASYRNTPNEAAAFENAEKMFKLFLLQWDGAITE